MNPFFKAEIYQTRIIADEVKASLRFRTEILISLERFFRQDWGELTEDDKNVNKEALEFKEFILAAYNTCRGKIWITAESSDKLEYDIITILFPEEY